MHSYIILLACRRCEWPACPPLSAWTHIPAPARCWICSSGLPGIVLAWNPTPGGLVLVGPGLQRGKSLGIESHPVAQSLAWSWSPTQTVWQPWEATLSLQKWHPMCPSLILKDCLIRRGSTGFLPSPNIYHTEKWSSIAVCTQKGPKPSFSPHQLRTWKQGQFKMSLTALFVGRIDLEVLAHMKE